MRMTATITVTLPENLEDDPVAVLTGLLAEALGDADVPVLRLQVAHGDCDRLGMDLAWVEEHLIPRALGKAATDA